MGTNSSWINMQQSAWQHTNLNSASRLNTSKMWEQSTNPMVFPTSTNHYGYNPSEAKPHGFGCFEFLPRPAFHLPLNSMNVPSGMPGHERLLIFDQSRDRANLNFSSVRSPFWNPSIKECIPKPFVPHNFGVQLPVFNDLLNLSVETNVSDGHGVDEMHEDTEEIDALLYSDSEIEDDEEASTGHSPDVEVVEKEEEVASSTLLSKRKRLDDEFNLLTSNSKDEDGEASTSHSQRFKMVRRGEKVASSTLPTKRRRLDDEINEDEDDEAASTSHSPKIEMVEREEEAAKSIVRSKGRELADEIDPTVTDTASSTRVHLGARIDYEVTDESDASSYASGRTEKRGVGKNPSKAYGNHKRFKRKKMHKTMGILRRLVPGGRGKDAAMVLDEAIRYLRTLKLKLKKLKLKP